MEAGKRESVHFDDDICLVGDAYYYRGTPIGSKKRREISLGVKKGATQKDVLAAKKAAIEGLENKGFRAGKNIFPEVSKRYVQNREEEAENPDHLSQHTLYETKQIIEQHLKPYAFNIRIEDIDQTWFSDYCKLKKRAGLNVVNHRKVINHFLKWCVSEKYLKYRPELVIPKTAVKPRRQRAVLNNEEVKRLVSACDQKTLVYVMMYLLMGMRNMEICKLRWDEIDFEKRALKINKLSNRKRKERAIPINAQVLTFLLKLRQSKRNDYVFPSARKAGKKPHLDPKGGIRNGWTKALTIAQLDRHITPHDLRATFETFMHVNTLFTDTQREKMAGAAIDVQKNTYVTMEVEHLRGLEESVQIEGLSEIIGGKIGGTKAIANPKKSVKSRNQKGKKR